MRPGGPRAPRRGEGGPADPGAWEKDLRERFERLRSLPTTFHVEVGRHPETHACAVCSAARRVQRVAEEVKVPVLWVEVAPVQPGQEGVAAPPPWARILLPGSEEGPVRFLGPLHGDLLGSFSNVLEDVAAGVGPSPSAWEEVLPRLRRRHHFRVFAAARCLDAPSVVRHLARVVHTSPDRLALDVIDVDTFPSMARRHGVRFMPTVTLDDFAHFYGPPDEAHLAHAVADVLPSGGFPFPGPRAESPFGSF